MNVQKKTLKGQSEEVRAVENLVSSFIRTSHIALSVKQFLAQNLTTFPFHLIYSPMCIFFLPPKF